MRLCMEVRQWQQLFGLYTTARIRYRPLSPGAEEFLVLELPHVNISWPLKRMEEILDVESLQYRNALMGRRPDLDLLF
ncbi:unnamed protein product [Sphagnum compactum]